MCGITGWVDWNNDLRNEVKTVGKMAKTLSQRGPDDSRVWSSLHAAFGHTRLVVVDPEGGKQPMTKSAKSKACTMAYNGELYNTEDIRKELLARGHSFKSHSDTEVLLTSFIEWGEACVDYLNGIYAFAIWDEKKEELFIARDRLGVKPLFYQELNGALLFGSELKAILAHPNVKSEVTREGLAEVFGLGPSRTPGHGVFHNMKELRPGHVLKYNKNGLKIQRYWNVKSEVHEENVEQTAEKINWLLKDTVERQLVADVPVSTFLSGGVDSSALTAFAANYFENEGRGPLHTYSIDYIDNDKYFKVNDFQPNADGPWIKEVSEFLGTKHHSCIITNEDLAGYLKEAVYVRDLPGMADIDSSLLWFCEKIKKDVTVGLSGECADEIFGGYPWFHREDLMNRESFPWMHSTLEREALLTEEWREKLQLKDYVMNRYTDTVAETPRLDGESNEDARRRELFYLNMVWFMTTLLDRKDRMSMGASLEVRVPFADHRLVEYVWNIPWKMKNLEGREKGILRKALEGVLPNSVLYRKKSPYPKTHNPFYTKVVKKWLQEIVDDPKSPLLQFVNEKKVRDIIDTNGAAFKKPWFGQLMTGPQLIAHLAQIDTWLRKYKVQIKE
ncbi:asparagine synthase (glutamine-hydrolyzing) [Anaerobacillus alkalidiazotrophicus]|uniref:asparagine synthase (glutamine-hydrolyzing) n=1 Tax=Anaerobacillus alkalidiazotrophicus TaxID=472963 RepID=A0A1S2M6K5_9BACI|nr:asparagine synthase (glutamine-hydrolyzing) [Anaerobacillus alkalidiazotrophicus]OIJ20359.1 asparagine synthase (glutamine-hydrolyzing) [Anaerobacillus alkalidiazotrophicus]